MQDTNRDSNYYQRSAFVLRVAKYATIFVFVIFLISCIVIFSKDITLENIQLLAKFINFDVTSSEYVDEFSTTANDESQVIMLRDNLGVINKNNISLYDLSGQKLFSYNYSLSAPAVVHDDHSIVVHDIKGNTLTVFNSFSKIKDFEYTGNVLSSDINDNFFCVITKDESFNSVLKVYEYSYHERDYLDIFTLKSSNHLTSCAISHNGRYVIASSASSHQGSYECAVHLYDTSSNDSKPVFSYIIENELPIKVGFADDNISSYVITDSAIHFFEHGFKNKTTYTFNQSKVENFYENDDIIVLTERNNLSGNSVMLIGISKYGKKLFEINTSDEIYDVCIGKGKIFALGKQNVYEVSKKENVFSISGKAPLTSKYFSVVCDTNDICYVLSDAFVNKVNFIK